jgi:hypothetical protein
VFWLNLGLTILALLFALTSIRNWIRRFSPRLTDTLFDSLVFITVLFSLFVQIKINSDSHATPYRQRIRSASAQVYVVIQREGSDDSFYKSERSYIELLMRNIEKICQLLGMVKPEQMRKG